MSDQSEELKRRAKAFGVNVLRLIDRFPRLPGAQVVARQLAETYMGQDNIETTEMRMGAEDFGYYTKHIPGCFYRLGVMNVAKGITSGVHTPTFNIDENAIETGMGMMAWLGASAQL